MKIITNCSSWGKLGIPPKHVYHIFPSLQKMQVVPLGPYYPWSYKTNCSQPRGFHPRRQRRYTDYLSPPQSLADNVSCTAVSYLSSQSIQFTSLLYWNQETCCCQSLSLTHSWRILKHFCWILGFVCFCYQRTTCSKISNWILWTLLWTDKKWKVDANTD